MRFAFVVATMAFAASSALAADGVFATLSMRDSPDAATLFSVRASLSNSENVYGFGFSNKRAHGKEGRLFKMTVANGLQNGFSGLISAFWLSVNGIDCQRLQLKRENVRKWTGERGEGGIEFSLNFDGALVDVRFWMRPDSPVLWGEVAKSTGGRQFTPITNAVVKVTAIPSYLECGKGRKTRFYKYARQVKTALRLLELLPNRREKIRPGDRYFILQDGEYDGTAEGRGNGPSATWPILPTEGWIVLNDSWTTSVEYATGLSRPFRFAMLEYRSRRTSNSDFQDDASIGTSPH